MCKIFRFFNLVIILLTAFFLSACGSKTATTIQFSPNDEPTPTPYVDKLANEKINITTSYKINKEFKADYQTFDPDGLGQIEAKARSIKNIPAAGLNAPEAGKKLILVEISVKGKSTNQGSPSTFNQIGDHPSPQFVLINQDKNQSYAETTYYSDSYTQDKNLFELSKITLDHDQWVHTAIVFEIDQGLNPSLAFRFTNPQGQVEFYAIE